MSVAGQYGQSQAAQLYGAGRYEEALTAANAQIAADTENPEPLLERAQILLALERFEEAANDVRECLVLDRKAQILDDALADDVAFSALVGWGKRVAPTQPEDAVRIVERYRELFPNGTHARQLAEWTKRFRGEHEMWVKSRE